MRSDEAAYIAWQLAAVAPWMVVPDSTRSNGNSNAAPLVAMVARGGYKAPKKLSDLIAASYLHRVEIMAIKSAVNTKQPRGEEREKVGMAIRRWDAQGGSWKLQVLNALLVDVMQNLGEEEAKGKH